MSTLSTLLVTGEHAPLCTMSLEVCGLVLQPGTETALRLTLVTVGNT